jgi:ABC-type iron transport system FetAB ATPase subunit
MRPDVIAHSLDRKIVMTKSDLFDAIRRHYEFSAAQLLLIPYLLKENKRDDGHWLLFIVDLSCDTVFVFDSTNKFKGAESVLNEIRTSFIAPHLSYLREYDGPLDKPQKGKVKENMGLAIRAEEFKSFFLTTETRQTDNFSCGFRVAHAILRIILERCRPQAVAEAVAFDMEEYRRLII